MGHCLRPLKALGLAGVVSFSDPVPRRTVSGVLIKPGHCRTLYQALNGHFVGRSSPRSLRLLVDGTVLSDRTIQKLRAREPGTGAIRERLGQLGDCRGSGWTRADYIAQQAYSISASSGQLQIRISVLACSRKAFTQSAALPRDGSTVLFG